MEDFHAAWRKFYPATEPIGYLMRKAHTKHWVRFHSLPQSKRYAENEIERKTVIDRANALASEILGHQKQCWLVQVGDPGLGWPAKAFRARDDYDLAFAYAFRRDECDWNVYANLVTWSSGKFDMLIESVANDDAGHTLWMSESDGAVFAPYDGGTDLFVSSEEEANRLKATFPGWLSQRSDRL